MTVGKGHLVIAGLKKETTFGTSVAVGAGNGFEFNSESISADAQFIPDRQISGQAANLFGDKGNEFHKGNLNLDLRYQGLDTLIALGLGTAGTPTQQTNRTVADGIGTATSANLTSATAAFVTADVGKRITIAGAGTAGATLDTTIPSRTSATVVVLATNVVTTVTDATIVIYDDAYKHVWKPKEVLEGLCASIVFWHTGLNVREYVSCKVDSIEISCKQGERAKIVVGIIAHSLNINTSTGTNTTTTAATITLPSTRDFLLFSQLVVRINDQSGIALASGDKVSISEFKFKIDNMMSKDDVTTQYGYLPDEPVRDNFMKITGSLTLSKYQDGTGGNLTLFADQLAKTRKKMDVVWIGPTANGANTYKTSLFFPDLQFTDGSPNIAGPQRIGYTLNFDAHRCASAPTGFTAGYTQAIIWEMVNLLATDALT